MRKEHLTAVAGNIAIGLTPLQACAVVGVPFSQWERLSESRQLLAVAKAQGEFLRTALLETKPSAFARVRFVLERVYPAFAPKDKAPVITNTVVNSHCQISDADAERIRALAQIVLASKPLSFSPDRSRAPELENAATPAQLNQTNE